MDIQMSAHRSLFRARASRRSRLTAALIAAAMLIAAALAFADAPAVADTAPPSGLPATVSADALPTAQMNGVAWAQVTVGNTVYVTGNFTAARPAGVAVGGTGTVTRSNLLAYNITTGVLSTTFVHSLNGQGRAIAASPDGTTLYVGGDFTTVDGATHTRIAEFNLTTNALVTTFTASANAIVRALAATNTGVFVGGEFTSASGTSRSRIASFTKAGALSTWNPGANSNVQSLVISPDGTRVIAGGQFSTLAGATALGMGSVSVASGASQPWAANTIIKDSGSSASIDALTTDGAYIYGAGLFTTVGGNFEGRFSANPTTGAIRWMNNCHGDSYSVYATTTVLYSASHEHDCSDIGDFPQDSNDVFVATHHYVAAESTSPNGGVNRHPIFPGGNGSPNYTDFAGQPVSTQLNWWPTLSQGTFTGQSQAAWSLSGNGNYVSVGGEFPRVNGTAQQGLVRFAISSIAPDTVGPTTASSLTPIVTSTTSGTARVAWQATSDQDNVTLTYSLYRDGGTTAIYTTTNNSTFWDRINLGYTDTGLATGSSHSYRVTARDPFGNTITSGSTSVTVGSTNPTGYGARVRTDGASHYWPLTEASGASAIDRAGYSDLAFAGTPTLGATAGPVSGTTASTFSGGETQPASTGIPLAKRPNGSAGTTGQNDATGSPFTVEAWVKTTSTTGGAILDYGLYRNTTYSAAIDKVLYIDAAGKIHFGVQNNATKQAIVSPNAYNNGTWHLVDATLNGTSATLYVDGASVATGSMTDNIVFPGYWRIGADQLSGWPAAGDNSLVGSIGQAATYPSALAASSIAAHYTLGTGGVAGTNVAPTAAFTSTCTNLACTVNGSGSSDSDGTIASYAWNFGDGGTATGATASHTYTTAGTYTITLTVTDDDGATNSTTRSVTVTAATTPNQAPTAAFTSTCTNLACTVNGSGSTDSDGTIASYAWNFGDNGTATGATASHTYTTAGTYTITLTVTDDDGATNTVTHSVTVTAATTPNQAPTAAFTPSCTNLGCTVNGSASTDSDGTIASYAWNFGDSSTATGATASHTYAAAGTYTITLTVTDDDGATNTVTRSVTVTAGTTTLLASDAFNRTVSGGFGTASPSGGAWTGTNTTTDLSVTPGDGVFTLPVGATTGAYLGSVSTTSTDVFTTFTVDKVSTAGNGIYLYVIPRRVNSTEQYLARVRIVAGSIRLSVSKYDGSSTETTIGSEVTTGTLAAGATLNVRVQATGTSPTTLRARTWAAGTTEPTTWQVSTTDASAAIQAAGAVGLKGYLSSSVTNGPFTTRIGEFTATPVQ
jgi:PKD repeat protein